MAQEPRESLEPVEPTQDSQSNDNSNSKIDIWIKRGGAIAVMFATIAGGVVAILTVVNDKNNEPISKSPQTESQIETSESTELWNARFKTKNGEGKEPEENEELQLSFKNGNVEGISEAKVDGIPKEWTYSGHKGGDYLALSYRGINTSTLGTVLLEQVADGKYIGYWEGKLCSDSNFIVRCPYVLAKGDSVSLNPKQISHLSKSCSGTEFNSDSNETLTENPCL